MTMQADDFVIYNKKQYTLIDVEKGKSMIDEIPCMASSEDIVVSTACWRGYTAEYYIVGDCLYGKRQEDSPRLTRRGFRNRKLSSGKKRLHYSGSCIVAYADNGFRNSDFLECYLHYDEALELHFTEGILDEVRNLNKAVEEFQIGWEDGTVERDADGIITRKGMETREYLTRRDLKYQYDVSTYKWRER